ncbi:MAG TPA: hypothetical protein VEH76_10400 [Methylocystis sp.]|nr:hypothetical protein [Methylocystis sp.]
MSGVSIEPAGAKTEGPCSCCGAESCTVWSFAYRDGWAAAAISCARPWGASTFMAPISI